MQISLAPDLSLLAIMVIFWLNYVVVRKFFLRPINDVIEAREHETKTAETIFEQAMTHFQEATAKIEAQLTTARREASQLREQFRSEAAEFRNSVIEKTSNEAKATTGEAEKHLEADVAVARKKIASESESLARLAAERILGRSL
ncbi:MAG: F0F1 ATP synthase subunit B family protein [Thermoanaerobaculia bacterium]